MTTPLPAPAATLPDVLRRRARRQPDRHAYDFLTDGTGRPATLTYAALDRRARAIGHHLAERFAPGERALLLYPPGLDYVAGLFGTWYAGLVAVPTYPPDGERAVGLISRLAADSRSAVALTTAAIADRRPLASGPVILATDDLPEVAEDPRPPLAEDSIALLQYTSGSTTAPRGVVLSHGNLMRNMGHIERCFGHTADSRAVSWLPPYHDMGLIGGLLQPLYVGFPVTLMTPQSFVRDPLRWLRAISEHRATSSGGPNFAYDLAVRRVTPEQRDELDLSSWHVAFSGAEPVRAKTLARFAEYFAPCGLRPEALYPCYGLAEATLIVSGGDRAARPVTRPVARAELERGRVAPDPDGYTLVGCGTSVPGQRVRIVDPETARPRPPGVVGEVWVSGASVAQGYWGRREETAATFGARLADSDEGPFLRTGDLGFLDDGELFITGRLKDLITIRGRNCYPEDIEFSVARAHPALRPAAGAAFSVPVGDEERLVVVHEVEGRHAGGGDLTVVIEAIRERVAARHALQAHTVVLVRPGGVPRTTSGKVQRSLCRSRFLDDALPVVVRAESADDPGAEVPPVTRDQLLAADPEARAALVREYVHHAAARLLRVPPAELRADRLLTEHGLDSVAGLELAHGVETATGVCLPASAVLRGLSVGELAALILSDLADPADPAEPTGRAAESPADRSDVDEYPLSPGQQAMWTMHQLAGDSGTYNVAAAVRIAAEVDVPALRTAFERLIARHAVLRTTYSSVGGTPLQVRHDTVDDWFHHETGVAADGLRVRLDAEAARSFDLEWEGVVRVHLFTMSATEHALLLVAHHIAVDFWSLELLLRELGECYGEVRAEAPPSGRPPIDYLDHVDQQSRLLDGPDGERMWDYWRDRLSGTLPVLQLPTDRARPATRTYRGASHQVDIEPEVADRVRRLAAAEGTTPFAVLLAAYQTLLSRYGAEDEVVVGVPMAGRGRAALADVVGYVSNTVPIRTGFAGDPAFAEVVRQVRDAVAQAAEHQEYPFSRLVERLGVPRDATQPPLFQTTFTYHADRLGHGLAAMALGVDGVPGRIGELPVTSVALNRRATQFDIALAMAETGAGLACQWTYNADLFDAATVARIAGHLRILLRAATADPDRGVTRLSLRTEHEERLLSPHPARPWRSQDAAHDAVHRLFEAQAARTPDGVAVTDGTSSLSYRELNERSNRLARHLRLHGARPESVVALLLRTGVDYVVAVLAVLKTGAAYLPLDPDHPRPRLEFMIRDSGAALLVAQTGDVEFATGLAGGVPVCDPSGASARSDDGDLGWDRTWPAGLACLLYTSGTTGEPKGVLVTHAGLTAQVRSLQAEFGLKPGDRQLVVQSFAFAASMRQLFVPLCQGATVILASPEHVTDVAALFDFARRQGATVLSANPSYWQHCLDALHAGGPEQAKERLRGTTFRLLLAASEPMPSGLPSRWLATLDSDARFVNMLGHTELSGIATTYAITDQTEPETRTALVGRPIPGIRAHVLDRNLAPVPFGVPGELYLSGPSLARGYRDRPGLTAERFIPDPSATEPGGRLYRTGDVVRHRPSGDLEHLGRADDQIKVRGFRIEPGEIEAMLDHHDEVRASAVAARADGSGELRLVAYVVPIAGAEPTATTLRGHLREHLPEHMVPSVFAMLPELPRNPNGKVDRRALPEPPAARPRLEEDFVFPQSRLELRLAEIWAGVLGIDRIGLHDNFFDVGGTSLTLLKAHQLVCAEFEVELPVTTLFQRPTLHALATHLAGLEAGPSQHVERSRSAAARRRQLTDVVRARRRGGRS
ncbi:non-ribosomal peptide synthetase [Streptomyces sp. ME19-01-6]|uniref:non-ribosomal peptide synthetase n=1 Tax=Streptomyces sp. ME19-01-6 TaxID=3028686 RepID=UPI0029A473A3|nr:non-ribosomal peptide synthetase [Streptomyces sp. ME19-01-6]MDX3229590.1 amino acid adenylation domain-containing protein [Streptomyces sp. ME19-01-6]